MDNRAIWRGKRINTGEWVEGWVVFRLHDGDLTQTRYSAYIQIKDYMNEIGKVFNDTFEVDPATVEPLAVMLIKRLAKNGAFNEYYCPNCDVLIGNDRYGRIRDGDCRTIDEYCSNCGQRLDWSEPLKGGGQE